MIDLDWLKAQGIPPWAQHLAQEVHSLQQQLTFSTYSPPAGADVAPTPVAPATPPAIDGPTGTVLDGVIDDVPDVEPDKPKR